MIEKPPERPSAPSTQPFSHSVNGSAFTALCLGACARGWLTERRCEERNWLTAEAHTHPAAADLRHAATDPAPLSSSKSISLAASASSSPLAPSLEARHVSAVGGTAGGYAGTSAESAVGAAVSVVRHASRSEVLLRNLPPGATTHPVVVACRAGAVRGHLREDLQPWGPCPPRVVGTALGSVAAGAHARGAHAGEAWGTAAAAATAVGGGKGKGTGWGKGGATDAGASPCASVMVPLCYRCKACLPSRSHMAWRANSASGRRDGVPFRHLFCTAECFRTFQQASVKFVALQGPPRSNILFSQPKELLIGIV